MARLGEELALPQNEMSVVNIVCNRVHLEDNIYVILKKQNIILQQMKNNCQMSLKIF